MTRCILPLLFFSLSLLGCGSNGTEQSLETHPDNETDTLSLFRSFIKKFPVRTLPIHKCVTCDEFGGEKLESVSEPPYSMFLPEGTDYINCWGMLTDTSQYYYLIWSYPADNVIPVLAIFNKQAKLLSSEKLQSGPGCGPPCCIFRMHVAIEQDYSVSLTDTMWSEECDPNGNVIDSTQVKIERTFIEGKIQNDKFIKQEPKTETLK